MRPILLCFILGIGSFTASAQVTRIDTASHTIPPPPQRTSYTFNTDYLYTIALKVYGYEQLPLILDQSSGQPYHHTYVNGFMFKFNNNQLSYRLQASYFDRDITFGNECEGCYTANGSVNNTMFKAGIEKNINYLRVQPYFGLDLGFITQKFDGRITQSENSTTNKLDKKSAYLASPFLGIKFYLVPQLALGVEASLNVAYSHQRTTTENTGNPPVETSKYRWEIFSAPVAGITLQYSFGSMNY